MQKAGESYDHYKTSLRKLAEGCDFDNITPDEILRDRLAFGINNGKVRESLLREAKLTLSKMDEIYRAAESMRAQMKMVGEIRGAEVNKIHPEDSKREARKNKRPPRRPGQQVQQRKRQECNNCGFRLPENQESCPAQGRECHSCGKRNHFASRRCQEVKTVDDCEQDEEEMYQTDEVSTLRLDDSQLVTFELESGTFIPFQPDTGAHASE